MARFFSRLLRIRWTAALRIARQVARELDDAHGRHDAHGRLEPAGRARPASLIKRSGGRPQRLSRSEHGEVVRLTKKAAGRLA
jgi:hypothetical protein